MTTPLHHHIIHQRIRVDTANATSSPAKDMPNQTSTENMVARTSSPASANTASSSPSPDDTLPALSIAVPSDGARDNVSVKTTARKAPKKQKGPPQPKKAVIGPKKRVWVERKALKYCIEVDNPGYAAIKANTSNTFCFYGECLCLHAKGIYK